jgi:hypothetical protein
MFKEKIKGFIAGAVISALVAGGVGVAFASSTSSNISVIFRSLRIIIDGADKSATPEDSRPFIFNGRTYVPLRYIAESMGKQVLWDGDTSTIYINDEGNSREDVYFATQGYASSGNDIRLDNDKKVVGLYTQVGWANNDYRDNAGTPTDRAYKKRSIVFNLNGIARSVIGTIDMSGTENNSMEGKVIFYDQNDRMLFESNWLRNSTNPIPFEFSVQGVLQLRVEFIASNLHGAISSLELVNFRYSR